jgi:hypothetical protein
LIDNVDAVRAGLRNLVKRGRLHQHEVPCWQPSSFRNQIGGMGSRGVWLYCAIEGEHDVPRKIEQ